MGTRTTLRETHQAEPGDFEEFKWIIQYGDTNVWYTKPGRIRLRQMARQERTGREPDPLPVIEDPNIVAEFIATTWATAALRTPLSYELGCCSSGHSVDSDMACESCKEEKQEALSSISLQYCIVIAAWHDSNARSRMLKDRIYSLIRCGSREAAVSAAHASATIGCSTLFSCVLRLGETPDDRNGPFERVDDIWDLAEEANDLTTIRVFY